MLSPKRPEGIKYKFGVKIVRKKTSAITFATLSDHSDPISFDKARP